MKLLLLKKVVLLISIFLFREVSSQQDPHYTQYMLNTMSVNPAYAGSKGYTVLTALGRTQWVGFEGAPDTQTLSYDSQFTLTRIGFGINLINDELGPSKETYLDTNISYSILTGEEGNLAFGLKLGGRLLNLDWNVLNTGGDGFDSRFAQNITNKFLPTIGAGIYYYEPKWYLGLSVPNFLRQEHYDGENIIGETAIEEFHFFLITGYVFDIGRGIKFKPATLVKVVTGVPLSIDISANFLFNSFFRTGISWRLDDSIAALAGFQVNESFHIGYAYDLTTSNYNVANSGTHEVLLRYEIFKRKTSGVECGRFF